MGIKEIRDKFKKTIRVALGKPSEDKGRVAYSTGFMNFDAHTRRSIVIDGKTFTTSGVLTGAMTMISGETQTGKSTLGINLAINIIKGDPEKRKQENFNNGWIEYFAPEDGLELDRICDIGNLDFEEVVANDTIRMTEIQHASTENLGKLILEIWKMKLENKDVMTYKTRNIAGKMIDEYVPTVIVVDSLTMLYPEDLGDMENDSKNTIHMQQNNKNGVLVMRSLKYMREANIHLVMISHVSEKLPINGLPPRRVFKAISGKTNITGGAKVKYGTDLGIFLAKYPPNKKLEEVLKTEELSYVIEGVCFKNRMGPDGWMFNLVNTGGVGFSPLYSLIYQCVSVYNFMRHRSGGKYTMEGYEDTFYKKDMANLYTTDMKFRSAMVRAFVGEVTVSAEVQQKTKEFADAEGLVLDAMFDDVTDLIQAPETKL